MNAQTIDLRAATPTRFPGKRRRRGTNWGLCDQAKRWLYLEGGIAAFDTAAGALGWVADPSGFGKDRPMKFQSFDDAEVAQWYACTQADHGCKLLAK